MMKFMILLFLATTPLLGQTVLVPNVNPNAKELKHCLNTTKDTLLLESDYRIDRIQLDSKNHNKHIVVNLNTMQIPIANLPIGRTNVMVSTNKKIIVFSIIKNQLKTNSK